MNEEFELRLKKIEDSLNALLPLETDELWREKTFGRIDRCINDSHISVLTEPCSRIISLGGKRWRPLLLVLCAEMTSEAKKCVFSEEKTYSLVPLVEFAHTASLIHDDIEDGADTRRGKPCVHITYGTDVAINAASWLYFEAAAAVKSSALSDSEKLKFYELFLTELRLLHLGQAMDIKWHRDIPLIPSKEEYTAMVRNKTGTLARLAVKTGILAGGGSEKESAEAGLLAQDIGVGFQIIDDVLNLTTGNPGKKRGDDIVEGKKSLPVILFLQNHPEKKEFLLDCFARAKKEGIESPAVEEAVSVLLESGVIEDARKCGNSLIDENSQKLAEFFGTKTVSGNLIKELLDSMKK